MKSDDPSNIKKLPIEYSKVIANIPKPLLDEFDMICQAKYYSRVEGIKQALREFITNNMPEDYISPSMQKIVEGQARSAARGVAQGFVDVANDPKYQTLSQQTNKPSLTAPSEQK